MRGIFKVGYADIREFSGSEYQAGKIIFIGDEKTPLVYSGPTTYS